MDIFLIFSRQLSGNGVRVCQEIGVNRPLVLSFTSCQGMTRYNTSIDPSYVLTQLYPALNAAKMVDKRP